MSCIVTSDSIVLISWDIAASWALPLTCVMASQVEVSDWNEGDASAPCPTWGILVDSWPLIYKLFLFPFYWENWPPWSWKHDLYTALKTDGWSWNQLFFVPNSSMVLKVWISSLKTIAEVFWARKHCLRNCFLMVCSNSDGLGRLFFLTFWTISFHSLFSTLLW